MVHKTSTTSLSNTYTSSKCHKIHNNFVCQNNHCIKSIIIIFKIRFQHIAKVTALEEKKERNLH